MNGHLHLECAPDALGRTIVARQSFRSPMHLSKPYWAGTHLLINAVNPTAGLFAGDSVDLRLRAAEGSRCVFTSPSATRVFQARDGQGEARVRQHYVVQAGGILEVFPEMLIPHTGSRLTQQTRLDVDGSGRLLYLEMFAPGRVGMGESFAFESLGLRTDLHVDGRLAYCESYRLDGAGRSFPGCDAMPYYASGLLVGRPNLGQEFQKEAHTKPWPAASIGVSQPVDGVWVLKILASTSLALRQATGWLRQLIYQHQRAPAPYLRKL